MAKESCWGWGAEGSRRKQEECIKVEVWKKVLAERGLREGGKQKETAAVSYKVEV